MRSPSEGRAETDRAGCQGASPHECPEGGGPGGRGDGADAKLVSEVEERRCRAECGAAGVAEAQECSTPRGASGRAREVIARAVSERPKGPAGVCGAHKRFGADGRGRHGGGGQLAELSESEPKARSQRITFELTPRAEAGAVSRGRDDGTSSADPAYSACRSESGVERGVRPHSGGASCVR